jgi:CheY-like chemotaxis protein
MRILIADNDEVLLELIEPYLRKRGHEAQFASQGLECVACLHRSTPDVIVLSHDLLWGGCHGILAELQDDPLLSRIPVILIAD